jgi:hypothetical protein
MNSYKQTSPLRRFTPACALTPAYKTPKQTKRFIPEQKEQTLSFEVIAKYDPWKNLWHYDFNQWNKHLPNHRVENREVFSNPFEYADIIESMSFPDFSINTSVFPYDTRTSFIPITV